MKFRKRIGKRILSFVLTLTLVAGMLSGIMPGTSMVAKADVNVAKVGDTEYNTFSEALNDWANGTTLTLLADVTTTSTIYVTSGSKTLDLNGHGIDANHGCFEVIEVNKANLTIIDSNPDAVHGYKIETPLDSNGAGLATVHSTKQSGDIEFRGGYITGSYIGDASGNAVYNGGVIKSRYTASVTVTGCTLIGNSAGCGGAIDAENTSSVSLTNTSVIGNCSRSQGAGVYNLGSTGNVSMKNCKIQYNYCGNNGGGGAAVYQKTIVIDGGIIANNACASGAKGAGVCVGGISNDSATLNLKGNVSIYGNKVGGTDNNLYLAKGSYVKITSTLSNTTPIGVTMATPGVFTNSSDTTLNDPSKFTSDNASYVVGKNSKGQLVLGEPCTVTYKVVNGTWADGSTADKTETLANGAIPVSVPTGMIASSGFCGGSWNTAPISSNITTATTFTYTFEEKGNISPTVSMSGYSYGGTKSTPTTLGNTGNGTVTYYYNTTGSNSGGTAWSTVISSTSLNPETYYMYAVVDETTNYYGATTTAVPFTVSYGTMGITVNNYTEDYDGQNHGVSVIAPEGATVTYGTSSTACTLSTSPTYKDAGTYTVYYKVTKANYEDITGTATVQINKKAVTVSGITADNKTYDGNMQAALVTTGASFGGIVSGDTLTVSATGAFSDANAANNKTVNITELTLGGASVGNYVLAQTGQQTSTTANIDKKAVTVTADNQSVSLNGNIDSSVGRATLSGALEGHTLHSVTLTPSSTANITTNGTITPSNATIYSGANDVTDNYEINYSNGVLTVTSVPASVTISPSANNRTYDKTEQPLLNNDGVAVGGTLYYALGSNDTDEPADSEYSTSIPSKINVGTYYVWYKAVKVNNNYTDSSPVCVPVTISQRPVTVSGITANNKTYDGTDTATLDYSAIDWIACGMVEGDDLGVTATGTFVDSNVSVNDSGEAIAKTVSITGLTLGGADVSNYTLADTGNQAETSAIIFKKDATVTAKNQAVSLAGSITDGVIMAELAGALDGHELTAITLTASSTEASTTAGTITPSAAAITNGADDVTANYDITYVDGTLTVEKAATGVTTPPDLKPDLVYTGEPLDLITQGEGVSGGTLVYAVTLTDEEPDSSEYSPEIPKADKAGVYYVWYKVVGDADHNDSDVTHFTVVIDKKEITISGITALDKTYDTTDDVTLILDNVTFAGISAGDELTVSAVGSFEDEKAGEGKRVDITAISLDGASIDNYRLAQDGQQTYTTAAINKKAVTVTALNQMIVIDGAIDTSLDMAVLEGAIDGHNLAEITLTSGSTASVTAEGVITPSEAIIISGDTDVTENYEITYVNGVMTVAKADSEVILDKTSVDEDTSITTVESPNLQEFAEKAAEDRKLVKVELSVKLVAEAELEADTVSSIKEAADTIFTNVDEDTLKIEYLEIDMTKYVDGIKEGLIGDTTTPIEIVVTYDTSKAGNPVIIRRHGGAVSVFALLSAKPTGDYKDATYYIDGNKIYIYSQYFSDFAIVYSVEKTFNINLDNGMGGITRVIVSDGAKYTPPTDLTRDGYAFDGWYKDEAFTEKWNSDTDIITADTKLYAKWTKTEATATEASTATVTEASTATTTAAASTSDATTASVKADEKTTPKTGDAMPVAVLVVLMLSAAGMLVFMDLKKRKN